MELDASGLEVLGREECLILLRTAVVGRVIFTAGALPAVLPVNFVLDVDDSIVVRTASGTRLADAARGGVVAFEADEIDKATMRGWSVVVTGRISTIREPGELTQVERLGLRPWLPTPRDRYIRVTPELVNGRRIHRPPDDSPRQRSAPRSIVGDETGVVPVNIGGA